MKSVNIGHLNDRDYCSLVTGENICEYILTTTISTTMLRRGRPQGEVSRCVKVAPRSLQQTQADVEIPGGARDD